MLVSARLAGKTALITGATSGIGTAIARQLCAEGANVMLTGRSKQRGEVLVADLGPGAAFYPADLADKVSAVDLVSATVREFGSISTLVNNAGVDHTGDLLTTPTSEILETFEINTFAALRLLQAAGTAMKVRQTGGAIINITSRLASIGVPTMGIYSASKGAVLSLTRAAAIELAPFDIRVNAVAPGMTRTPLYNAWIAQQPDPDAIDRRTAGEVPLGRLASPEDVAGAVAYLASDQASYITGASIPVDGGYTAH